MPNVNPHRRVLDMLSRRRAPVLGLVFFSLLLSMFTARRAFRASNLKHEKSNQAPAIGFDLTTSYGTAVVRNYDGSFKRAAMVQPCSGYKVMMQRLSHEASKHPSPPYANLKESLRDRPRQMLRAIKKGFGFPASADVEALSKLLRQLRGETEGHLGHRIESVVVSYSHNVALYEEDIHDALEHVGLKPWTDSSLRQQPYELSAALAGNELGLCEHPTDADQCATEETNIPRTQVLAISYTRDALELSLSNLQSAHQPYEPADHHLIDWAAGHDSLATHARPDAYWLHLHRRILELSHRELAPTPIARVLLLGDRAHDPSFRQVLRDALADFQPTAPVIHDADPLFAAARGAAAFAVRAQRQAVGRDKGFWHTRWGWALLSGEA